MIPGLSSPRPRQSVPNASIAQMVERKTLNLVVVGSIPTGGAFAGSSPGWASSAHRALGSHQSAALAQLGERQTEDLKVPGSIPGLSIFLPLLKAPCGDRTHDHTLTKRMLHQLS